VSAADQDSTEQNEATGRQAGAVCFRLGQLPRRALARDIRLRENDLIVAIDGKPIDSDLAEFAKLCDEAKHADVPLLLTIGRVDYLYDVLVAGPLGVTLDYADAAETAAATTLFADHAMGPKESYQGYEALRDIHRHVVLYNTGFSPLAVICPPAWLIQHRAWEPLAAVMAAYLSAFVVHWGVFAVTVLLLAAYFKRAQYRLIRNYSLFTEHYFWLVCAARSMAEAQMICRKLDPRARFDFSYVGPPAEASPTKLTDSAAESEAAA
jgi:hypothetical protein